MFLGLYEEVTNVLRVSLLSHDRYQYDSLILSKQTWAYSSQHLQRCDVRSADVVLTSRNWKQVFIFPLRYLRKLCVHYANGFDNVENVYFFCSNSV
jgi:hypothetical protein